MPGRRARLAALILAAALPAAAPPAAAGEGAGEAGERALRWLDGRVADGEWRKTPPALANEGARKRVAVVLAAFLHSVESRDGARPSKVHAALDALVDSGVGGGGGLAAGSFTSWLDGLAGVYLAEESLRTGRPHPALPRLVRSLEDGQNAEGGWGHGLDGAVDFYPSTLVAASNLALLSLGLARDRGAAVEPLALEDGIALLRAVQSPAGGLPYGGRRYLKGPEAGRTGGTVAAAAALGLAGDPLLERAARYFRLHAASVPDGHASSALHVFTGALAAWALGDGAWGEYEGAVLARVRAAQRGDGTLGEVGLDSLEESPLMGTEETNRAYVTALHAAALAVPRSRVARRLREMAAREGRRPAPPPPPSLPPGPRERWRAVLPGAGPAAAAGERVAVLAGDGRLLLLEGETGRLLAEVEADGPDRSRMLVAAEGLALVLSGPAPALPERASLADLLREGARHSAEPRRAAAFSLRDGSPAWVREVPGTILSAAAAPGRLLLLFSDGRVLGLSLVDGGTLFEGRVRAGFVNTALLPLEGGAVAVAAESRLTLLDGNGREAWLLRNPRRAGVTPEAWSALAPAPGGLWAGNTAGEVVRVDGAGRVVERTPLGSAVASLRPLPGRAGGVAALTSDGRVAAVEGGRVLWTVDAGAPPAVSGAPTVLGLSGARVAVASPAGRWLLLLDGGTGRTTAAVPLASDARVSFGDSGIAVVEGEVVRVY